MESAWWLYENNYRVGGSTRSLMQDGGRTDEIAQQTYANYEVARARPAVSMLPTLAQLFGLSVDELLGLHKNAPRKRGPTPLLQKQIGA